MKIKQHPEMVTLTNDFHNTECRVRTSVTAVYENEQHLYNEITLTASQAERAKKKLCGITDCCCSGSAAGHRGRQLHNGVQVIIEVSFHNRLLAHEE